MDSRVVSVENSDRKLQNVVTNSTAEFFDPTGVYKLLKHEGKKRKIRPNQNKRQSLTRALTDLEKVKIHAGLDATPEPHKNASRAKFSSNTRWKCRVLCC
jgi:hypothetical protein